MHTPYSYDATNRLTQIEHKNAGDDLLARYAYVLDEVGNRILATETISTPGQGLATTAIIYTYNSLYRLTGADYSGGTQFRYAYDGVGNRTVYTATVEGSPEVTSYGYDAANRLVNAGEVTYTWDNSGNLLDDGSYQYILR